MGGFCLDHRHLKRRDRKYGNIRLRMGDVQALTPNSEWYIFVFYSFNVEANGWNCCDNFTWNDTEEANEREEDCKVEKISLLTACPTHLI